MLFSMAWTVEKQQFLWAIFAASFRKSCSKACQIKTHDFVAMNVPKAGHGRPTFGDIEVFQNDPSGMSMCRKTRCDCSDFKTIEMPQKG